LISKDHIKEMTETPNYVAFTPERLAKVKETIAKYPEGRQKSALLPFYTLPRNNGDGSVVK